MRVLSCTVGIALLGLSLSAGCGGSGSDESVVPPASGPGAIRNVITVNNYGASMSKVVVMLPLPQSNPYQAVSEIGTGGGEVVDIPDTDDKYVRYIVTGNDLPGVGESASYGYTCRVVPIPVNIDFSQVNANLPRDTSSDIYWRYTGSSGEYVDIGNDTIMAVGDSLWAQSADIVDYARRCYDYVVANYQYLNPNTGLYTLAEIIANGGGDCGNLTSIFVSLMRYEGIPCRHVVTLRTDGTAHVWADFYVEGTGWIPVDVSGRTFGSYSGDSVVLTKQVWIEMEREEGDWYYSPILQTYEWWWWGEGDSVTADQSFTGN